jgi:hypothetical protein
MTAHKHLKQLIRARMEKTGERYAAARRMVLGEAEETPRDPATRWHFAGNVPATTALRTLLAHAGVRAPHTGKPFSEAMLFGIAGGIGIGVFSFYYKQGDIATFNISGRHQWHDHVAYLKDALAAFHIKPVLAESSGARTAQKQLIDALEKYGPTVAWVEGYRVITVYSVDEKAGTARIGDLTDDPITMPLADLSATRLRIKSQKCRLLSIPSGGKAPPLKTLVEHGLKRCSEVLLHPTLKMAPGSCKLEALQAWAERMHGSDGPESWSRNFRPGPNLWRGLRSIHTFIEHYGTGGGLCRPLFADFLQEASAALSRPALASLSAQYAALGRQWSDLADAALPESVPAFREAKEQHAATIEAARCGEGPLAHLEDAPQRQPFPLSDAESDRLRTGLKQRILALYEGEVAAHAALRSLLRDGL